MKKTYLTLFALFAGACSAYSSVQFTSTSFNGDTGLYATVVNNSNALIPNGTGYSALGFFNVDPAGLNSPAALAAQFVAFANGSFGGADVVNANGSYSVARNVPNPTPAAVAGGQQAYLVYGNSATLATSTQFAVVNTNRTFPANPADPGITAFTVDLVAGLSSGTVVYGTIVPLVASPTLNGAGLAGGNQSLRLAVPEPGVGILSIASIAILVIRRRRK